MPRSWSRSRAASTTSPPRLAEHGPFDVVLDPLHGDAATAASRHLAEHGRLVNLGGAGGDLATYSSAVLRSRTRVDPRLHEQRADRRAAPRGDHGGARATPQAGRIRIQYDVHPLAEVEQVWTRIAAGATGARNVLVP